jgi:hypothetical protein
LNPQLSLWPHWLATLATRLVLLYYFWEPARLQLALLALLL